MNTKKFWCHYIGNDGNTPKRRSIELTDIHELLPQVSNEGVKTPVWYETEQDDRQENIYFLYAQLSDNVAVFIPRSGIHEHDVELIRMTDEDIDRRSQERLEKYFANYPAMDEDRKAKEREWYKNAAEEDKMRRDRYVNGIRSFQDYDNFLLSGCQWVSASDIRAYEEVQSPILSGLQEIRRMELEKMKARERERQEEARKRQEEAHRMEMEAAAKEEERLNGEAEKFKNGGAIAGCDVVSLCRRHGIDIHLRTVHNLQQVIATINGKEGTCQYYRQRGKRRPQLDGCYKTAKELYDYLNK